MPDALLFYIFSGLMLAAALSVVLNRQPVYAVLSLLLAMFCLAALFVLLGAYFVAALQILLYVGAVLVLFLFVVMLLNLDRDTLARLQPFTRRGLGTLVALLFATQLILLLNRAALLAPLAEVPAPAGTVRDIGRLLFTTYLLPFELTSFLILAAIIGAVTLARGLWKPE
ncbi:MAG: NADH-quinone oxidoreductase subunit J [Candidatus Omnitrophica bacterium]|nr:NADH-quinone oxidoreductase subunit J [Candidatus Omnitrophota bacterium]